MTRPCLVRSKMPPFPPSEDYVTPSRKVKKGKENQELVAEREDLLESAMSEQWRMPPAQGVLVVKRLARPPTRATSRKFSSFIVLYCIIC